MKTSSGLNKKQNCGFFKSDLKEDSVFRVIILKYYIVGFFNSFTSSHNLCVGHGEMFSNPAAFEFVLGIPDLDK